jgi:hypothetical protein
MFHASRCGATGVFGAREALAVLALALGLVVTPAGLDFGASGIALVTQSALAKNDGDNPGNGGGQDHGNAGGNAPAAAERGNAADKNPGGGKPADKGKAAVAGKDKKDEKGAGTVAYTFSKTETDLLLARGWAKAPDGYKNHGEFVSTYVQVAKALGFSARDGALQANFLPADWYAKQAELRDLLEIASPTQAQRDRIAELETELGGAIADFKPGNGPDGDLWATVNLDYNFDGVVNQQDVADYKAGQAGKTVPAATVTP